MRKLQFSLRCRSGRLALVAFLASMATLLVAGAPVGAQQGEFVIQAAARLHKLTDQANKLGYKLDDNKFSMGGGWLKQGNDNWVGLFTLTLEAGKSYRVIAAGDSDARDVDVEILDNKSNKVVAKDDKSDATAVVSFTPDATRKYLIRVRLYASRDSVPCVCFAIVLVK